MIDWNKILPVNPIPGLILAGDQALEYFARRDLQDEQLPGVEVLWRNPFARKLVADQGAYGSWAYPGKSYDPETNTNYDLLETFRNLRILVEMYGFTREHSALQKAADYLFSVQTAGGDIRGIIGNQYMPYYHGAILEILIKAGYGSDERVIKGLEWLLSIRQNDGGWIVPAQQVPPVLKTNQFWHNEPLRPERSRPHSHLATGMVLRAFAVHPSYRNRSEVILAGEQLEKRLFLADKYNDRRSATYWLKFQFPFWWTSLLTAMDTLSRLEFSPKRERISLGLDWFIKHQEKDGFWDTGYGKGAKAEQNRLWVGLAVCRMIKRFLASKG